MRATQLLCHLLLDTQQDDSVIDMQVTLDDLWKLDLAKLDGWHMVKDNTAGQDDFKEQAEAESSSGSDGEWESDENGTEPRLPRVAAIARGKEQTT